MLEVVIGAVIGIVASLLTAMVAHRFERIRNREQHEREKNDRKKDKENAITEKRLSELERLATDLLIDAEKSRSFFQVLLATPNHAENATADFLNSTAFTTPNANQLQAVALSLNDDELVDIAKRIWTHTNIFVDLSGDTILNYRSMDVLKKKQLLNDMAENLNAFVITQSKFLKKIDQIRVLLVKSE